MKKTLIVLLTAMLAISMLFVSCSNEAKLDEPVSVQFVTPGSRSLSASVSADPETMVWHYKATKKSLTDFNYGATTDSIVSKDTEGNFYPVELSQGLWDFELWAVANDVEYYRGDTKGVLIEKRTDDTPVPISIVVSPFGGTGTIEIKDVLIAKKTTNGFINTTHKPNEISIKKDGTPISEDLSNFDGTCLVSNQPTGSYDIVLSYIEDNLTVARAEITVVVYSGKTTTVSGTIDETTSSGQFKVNVQKTGNSTTVTTAPITEGQVSSGFTLSDAIGSNPATVSIIVPANTVDADTTLVVEKKITEQPSTVNVTAGNGATFYDVKLQQVKDGVTTDLAVTGDNYFTVELYVGPNLDIVNFKHHDDELIEVDEITGNNQYMYNNETGYVTFTTSSFSPFTAEYKFGGGLGTEGAPYLISNNDQFQAIGNMDWNQAYHFKQTCDLVVTYSIPYFWGTYDGNNYSITTRARYQGPNYYYLFSELKGDSVFKNMHITMSNHAVALLLTASNSNNNDYAYSLEVNNILFTSSSDLITVNTNNFGLVELNPIWVPSGYEGTYKFINVKNYVNIQNEGTCAGMLIGSGPASEGNMQIIVEGCENYGEIISNTFAGFVWGNPSYLVSYPNWTLIASNCKNEGIIRTVTTGATGFALRVDNDNEYRNAFGGIYITGNIFDSIEITVNQENDKFAINSSQTEYEFRLGISTPAKYWTKDGEAWEDSDVQNVKDGNWSQSFDVANSLITFIDSAVVSGPLSNECKTFHSYDKKSALNNNIIDGDTDFAGAQWLIIAKEDKNYIVFNTDETEYIDCNSSLVVFAYQNGKLVGKKNVK